MSSRARPRADLDARVLEWIGEAARPESLVAPDGWDDDDARFEALALDLFRYQFEHCEPYARFCEASGVPTPDRIVEWRAIPAVPASAFKEARLTSFPADEACAVFRTSGTTGQSRGELHLDTLEIYEASLLASLARSFVPELAAPEPARAAPRLCILTPPPSQASDSSLSHMFGTLAERLGQEAAEVFFVEQGEPDFARFDAVLEDAAREGQPVALCGTAFAFVHWLDRRAEGGAASFRLASGSRLLETGGFKGRSREVTREELHGSLAKATSTETTRIVNQYGMTELGSQFYDSSWIDTTGPRRKLRPPWVRVRIIDPRTRRDARPGDTGIIVIHDLANTGSVAALQTADLGRAVATDGSPWGEGFEVLGRAQGAEARGCSIAADETFRRALGRPA